ncbi:arsenate reductase [Limnobacter humi]|uniref:Arsenate reductase n=1 Tax=Limnobacter humi TaxID=1778671 RepID=A0ABT1WH27_9BURK|nr:ArsC/Spx/MgsR family protein [Limnobacter humi]MCQ8896047.1 arsenate reductase [Limnobacter humi]
MGNTVKQVEVYGIPNCDSVKKALKNLKDAGVQPVFHNFKTEGVDPGLLSTWLNSMGVDKVINKKGTTWRGLSVDVQAQALSSTGAHALALNNPSVIKRPVVKIADQWTIGLTDFSEFFHE